MTQSEQSSTASRTDGKASSTPTSERAEPVRGSDASKPSLGSMRAGLGPSTDCLTGLETGRGPGYPLYGARDVEKIDFSVRETMARVIGGFAPWPLVLLGEAGVGKTCAALCLLDRARGGRRYWVVADLSMTVISVQDGEAEYGMRPDTLTAWWARYAELKCVVLDELVSRGKVSDFGYETVKRAIDSRHGKPLVVVSNGTIETIARVYDDRIASRLAAGTVIEMTGSDRRLEVAT